MCIIAIDQVSGVMVTCELVGLINQCTVVWNVSNNSLLHVFMFASIP